MLACNPGGPLKAESKEEEERRWLDQSVGARQSQHENEEGKRYSPCWLRWWRRRKRWWCPFRRRADLLIIYGSVCQKANVIEYRRSIQNKRTGIYVERERIGNNRMPEGKKKDAGLALLKRAGQASIYSNGRCWQMKGSHFIDRWALVVAKRK